MLTTILTAVAGAGLLGAGLKYFGANEKIGDFAEEVFYQIFSKITLVLNKLTLGLWNKTLEPLLECFIARAAKGAARGLNSDD